MEGLPSREQEQVQDDNILIDFSLSEAEKLNKRGAAAVIENPRNSWLWQFSEAKALTAGNFEMREYCACAFFAARCKLQSVAANFEEMKNVQTGECRHIHTEGSWKPHKADGKWVYPALEEAEYTPSLAFTMAVATSFWAIRVGRAKLRVFRYPEKAEWGSRLHWEDYNPQALRSWIMPVQARALGLQPPKVSPGDWFPETDLAMWACSRRQTGEKAPAGLDGKSL